MEMDVDADADADVDVDVKMEVVRESREEFKRDREEKGRKGVKI